MHSRVAPSALLGVSSGANRDSESVAVSSCSRPLPVATRFPYLFEPLTPVANCEMYSIWRK